MFIHKYVVEFQTQRSLDAGPVMPPRKSNSCKTNFKGTRKSAGSVAKVEAKLTKTGAETIKKELNMVVKKVQKDSN